MAKCLTGRTKTVEKAQAAFMLWIELEAVDQFLVLSLSLSLSRYKNLLPLIVLSAVHVCVCVFF